MDITPSEYSKLLKVVEERNLDVSQLDLVKDYPINYRGRVVAKIGTLPKYKLSRVVMLVTK